MKLNTNLINGKWFTYDEDGCQAEFFIRPLPNSLTKTDLTDVSSHNYYYNHCLVDWKNVLNENNEPLEFNDTNKQLMFDYCLGVAIFVLVKAREVADEVSKEIKN